MDIAERVTRLLDATGWSRQEQEERTGLTRNALYKLTSGKTGRPHRRSLRAIANALGVPLADLLDEEISDRDLVALLKKGVEPGTNGTVETREPDLPRLGVTPVVHREDFGGWDWEDLAALRSRAHETAQAPAYDDEQFLLVAEGADLTPATVHKQIRLLITPNARVSSGCMVVTPSIDGTPALRQYVEDADGARLDPTNAGQRHVPMRPGIKLLLVRDLIVSMLPEGYEE